MWIFPALLKKMTYKPDNYPFVYYSTILDQLCTFEFDNKTEPMKDKNGKKYTTTESDSLMPMLKYRQLMSDGRLPDSIKGVKIEPKQIMVKSVIYRQTPSDISTPRTNLYLLFETMPKRVGLEVPNDVFRLKNKIEFIDTESNKINQEKSNLFQNALIKEDYTFPTQWAIGNPNPRKPYDEGYFCLDAKGQLFHLKMVNGRPYVKNTHVSDNIQIASFSMLEVPDKRFYGFLYSKSGDLFIIENEGGNYQTQKLDIDPINTLTDDVVIMGNMFDWTVSITTPNNKKCYGLDVDSLKSLDTLILERTDSKWDVSVKWIFPVYLTFDNNYSSYIKPVFTFTALTAFVINFILAVLMFFLAKNTQKRKIFNFVYVLLTGVAGFLALTILPGFRKKY